MAKRTFDIRYGSFFKIPRKIAKHFLSTIYPLVIKVWPLPRVLSIEETLNKIIKDKSSIVRFGDSEFLYLIDKLNLPYQKYDEVLAQGFREILKSNEPNILVGLPIGYYSHVNLNRETELTWRSQISWIYPRLRKFLDLNKVYYNASMTRLYMDYEDRSHSGRYFELVMKIWEGREVLLIEGEKSRLGLGNDLFAKAVQVERIIGPAHHGFSRYNDLYNEALKHSKDKLVLLSMGPAAKMLAFNLAKQGYQVVDIGNVDIEYEWYKRGDVKKTKIPGKYTSEAKGGRIVEDTDDALYHSQIVAKFL